MGWVCGRSGASFVVVTLAAIFTPGINTQAQMSANTQSMRPPAVPLIVHDPYFSVWSMADHLTDGPPKHWSGVDQDIHGIVRVDQENYRFLGAPSSKRDQEAALTQTSLTVTPTRTTVVMTSPEIELDMEFMNPLFPDDMALLARPVTYVTWTVKSRDHRVHQVEIYLDAAGTLATNDPGQPVEALRGRVQGLDLLRIGTRRQSPLDRFGDNVRIDWGWFVLAVPQGENARIAAGNASYRNQFLMTGSFPDADDLGEARPPQNHYPPAPTVNLSIPLGAVGDSPVERHILVAYDDIWSVEYMQTKLRPWWRTQFPGFAEMLAASERDYASLEARSRHFDQELQSDLLKAGGEQYASIATLAYSQAMAAQKLVEGPDGKPFFMPKENFSNGSISTVDVIYPSAPMFLLLNPGLVEAQLDPVFTYASMPAWKFPFAPHDLGVYPLANGQQYGGGEVSEENQMPVEESGDMILLAAAVAHAEKNADYPGRHWALLSQWAEYLLDHGLDPANQLCTDDFAGHLAHNANLSIKAIEALGAFAQMADDLHHPEVARRYRSAAQSMAQKWVSMAEDGDHYRLAFDKPNTWSQKYNLVWDTVLGLHLFPPAVAAREVAFYQTKMNPYGLPLDDRASYTKLDWEIWTATLATHSSDFERMTESIYKFLNETPERVPMTDWYDTITAHQVQFQARSVVGGVYMKMLADPAVWSRWVARDRNSGRPLPN
ncbi:MAG: glutaminase domain-containing protein [Acidobacteriota bacterium]